eukprot:CAMPEP_0178925476 /NCGR_PEP_ID=MMETSP0786-20121207/17936_1 /TAXON_ID=186022 /ORGANISM="Thalassionema frauenfeldii, Strain CCMP 1798" /LENGTH=183 /DNA_ID=CAMNT_0020600367 /DNA_START=36 /DNA_END=587 /DNA_ORIENTATION=-
MEEKEVVADITATCKKRDSLDGCWILDRSRGCPSMRPYLETMGVDELAIQANEKGDAEHDTYNTITSLDGSGTEQQNKKVIIVKRSRVNNDLTVELELEKEFVQKLAPGDREKKTLATGLASIVDEKKLVQEETGGTSLLQELTITNVVTGDSHTTLRYFVPYTDTPPHLVDNADQDMPDASK